MTKFFTLMAAMLLTASVYAGEFADISIQDVKVAATAKTAVIIDANSPDSDKAGHVPGALSFAAIKDNLTADFPCSTRNRDISHGNPSVDKGDTGSGGGSNAGSRISSRPSRTAASA